MCGTINSKEILKILKNNGWDIVRQHGSHIRLKKEDKATTVPNHGTKDIGIGLLKAIEKQTGVKLK